MRLKLGTELSYNLQVDTPMIVMLNVHPSRAGSLEYPDHLVTSPAVPIDSYIDGFGNSCRRLVAPAGAFSIRTDTVLRDDGQPDPVDRGAVQLPVEALPNETLAFLLPSRYCESDRLADEAWRLFGNTPPGWDRVQTICDFVNGHLRFEYATASPMRAASEAYSGGIGVCRDFAHLAITFCRAMNIPTRYCTGYISDVGQPPPYAPMDLAAWMEVYLGDRWHVFDPRNNQRRIGRVLIARGRDAADVPITHTFGPNILTGFTVITEEIQEGQPAAYSLNQQVA